MILRIGSWYSNANNALHKVLVENFQVIPQSSPRLGEPFLSLRRMQVLVTMDDLADQAAVKTAIDGLETAARATSLSNIALYHDVNDTSTPGSVSAHSLLSPANDGSTRLGNPRLVLIDWVPGIDVEYATRRTCRLIFEADYQQSALSNGTLIEYQDSVSYDGFGGALKEWSAPITGTPVPVTLRGVTPRFATQSGNAVTWGTYAYATKLWSSLLNSPASNKTAGPINYINGAAALYNSSWRYRYEGVPGNATVDTWPS